MNDGPMECPAERGIHEIWRQVPGDYYSPSIEAFAPDGPMAECIRISVGGSVVTMPVRQWHRYAFHGYDEIDHGMRIRQVEELSAEVRRLQAENGSLREKLAFHGEYPDGVFPAPAEGAKPCSTCAMPGIPHQPGCRYAPRPSSDGGEKR